jgi:hypothetical protein
MTRLIGFDRFIYKSKKGQKGDFRDIIRGNFTIGYKSMNINDVFNKSFQNH